MILYKLRKKVDNSIIIMISIVNNIMLNELETSDSLPTKSNSPNNVKC